MKDMEVDGVVAVVLDLDVDPTELSFPDLIDMIAQADEAIATADGVVKRLKEVRAKLEEEALPRFAEAGVQNVKLSHRQRTVYLHRSIFASVIAETSAEFVEVLDDMGLGDLAPRSIHPSRLTSLVREWREQHDDDVPEQVKPFINHGERYSVRSRKN